MARGFISGLVWGCIAGGALFLAGLQLADWQDPLLPQPQARSADMPDATEFAEVKVDSDPIVPDAETAPGGDAETALAPVQPRVEGDTAPAVDDTPVLAPATVGSAPEALQEPVAAAPPQIATAPEVAAPERPEVTAPDQPLGDTPLVAGRDAPPTPERPVADPPAATNAPPEIDATPGPAAPVAEDEPPVIAAAPAVDETPPTLPATDAAPEPVAPAVEPDDVAVAPPPATAPSDPVEPEPEPAAPVEVEPDPAETAIAAAMPGEPAAPLPGLADEDDEARPEATVPAGVSPGDGPALQAYRETFDNPDARPVVSLVLILPRDGGEVALDVLANLPFPVSFAVDAASVGVADTARSLRDAGREIVMIPSLPEGATPADVEVALQANLADVPEAVAYLDAPDASFQSDRTAVAQVVAAAGATGHGLITFPRGLNTAQQIAQRDGVPSGLVFRDIDADGQSNATIRRALDQAAFRARQEGSVILVARARAETIAALTEWALGNRAASVALAPVSAAIAPSG